jgi:alpha-tubulin suppressor-like RCC1 family protein
MNHGGKANPMKKICAKRFASLSLIITVVAAGMPLAAHAGPEVVAWGDNDSGQTSVPSGLSNVVAIAAGSLHSLALTAKGRVVAWGSNGFNQTDVPSANLHATA